MQNRDRRSGPLAIARRRRRLWLVALLLVLSAVAGWCLWAAVFRRDLRLADERLAEIEAARAIPDAENAAMIYSELLQDPKAASLSNAQSQAGEPLLSGQPVLYRPWLSKDQPEADARIKGHRDIVDRLLAAARFEKCRFPIIIDVADTSAMYRGHAMRQWGFLLRSAANNDIAEGRVDAAMMKWQCLLQMGNHLRQQPDLIDHLLANSVAEAAMEPMRDYIVTGGPTETHLQKIEAMSLPMEDHWAEYDKETRLTEALISQRVKEQISPLDCLRHPIKALQTFRVARTINSLTSFTASRFDDAGYLYRRNIATARGIRILVALRRYKDTNGRWPARLQEIQACLPEEALTDPRNKGSFVYRLTPDGFRLYSRGQNNVDEEGTWDPDNGPDDWPIWPPRDRRPNPKLPDANSV
jgi:hypothetical protein